MDNGIKKIKLTENQLHKIFNEVRYIDTSTKYKKNPMDVYYNQEPIKNGESIRVFHGCGIETALKFAKNGLSGQVRVPRTYSYEMTNNPKGLFVTTSLDSAKNFYYHVDTLVIMEFTVNSSDLDTPVWKGQDTHYGQYSNPPSFDSKAERDAQKEKYQNDARNSEYDYVRNSDNPAMAYRIFINGDHQALFMGNLNPNQIKRFWVKKNGSSESMKPFSRKDFLRVYGDKEFQEYTYQGYKNYKVNRDNNYPYLPNEDFVSFEDFAKRELDLFYSDKPKLRQRYDDEQYALKVQKEADRYRKYFEDAVIDNDYYSLRHFSSMLYPKQMKQLFGDDLYDKVFSNDIM